MELKLLKLRARCFRDLENGERIGDAIHMLSDVECASSAAASTRGCRLTCWPDECKIQLIKCLDVARVMVMH